LDLVGSGKVLSQDFDEVLSRVCRSDLDTQALVASYSHGNGRVDYKGFLNAIAKSDVTPTPPRNPLLKNYGSVQEIQNLSPRADGVVDIKR
jgi:hypothetical protein